MFVVRFFIKSNDFAFSQIPSQFTDMHRLLVTMIQLLLQFDSIRVFPAVTNANQCIPETVSNTPGVSTLAYNDAFDA